MVLEKNRILSYYVKITHFDDIRANDMSLFI